MICVNPAHTAALASYPVGSIYMSVNAASPETLFGGTWERIQGRFLFAADGNHLAGSTGGAENVTLTESQLPNLSGSIYAGAGNSGAEGDGWGAFRQGSGCFSTHMEMQYGQPAPNCSAEFPSGSQSAAWAYADLKIGGGQSHTNMPPYLAVYVWKRTA